MSLPSWTFSFTGPFDTERGGIFGYSLAYFRQAWTNSILVDSSGNPRVKAMRRVDVSVLARTRKPCLRLCRHSGEAPRSRNSSPRHEYPCRTVFLSERKPRDSRQTFREALRLAVR